MDHFRILTNKAGSAFFELRERYYYDPRFHAKTYARRKGRLSHVEAQSAKTYALTRRQQELIAEARFNMAIHRGFRAAKRECSRRLACAQDAAGRVAMAAFAPFVSWRSACEAVKRARPDSTMFSRMPAGLRGGMVGLAIGSAVFADAVRDALTARPSTQFFQNLVARKLNR